MRHTLAHPAKGSPSFLHLIQATTKNAFESIKVVRLTDNFFAEKRRNGTFGNHSSPAKSMKPILVASLMHGYCSVKQVVPQEPTHTRHMDCPAPENLYG